MISLFPFNPGTEQLSKGKKYGFEGLLPEQVTFDTSGNALAVVIYRYQAPSPKIGTWHVIAGKSSRLERTGYKLEVVRGAHDIVLVP